MFNVVQGGRKYVPARSPATDGSPLALQAVHVNRSPGKPSDLSEATWPPPGARMRNSKGGVVKAVRRNASPQPASLENLRGAWSEKLQPEAKPPEGLPNGEEVTAAGDGLEGHGGGPPRNRKKGFRPPDVRTIFSPGEKDPRVKEESGEGHTFEPGEGKTWCDLCRKFIFKDGLTCTGECAADGGGSRATREVSSNTFSHQTQFIISMFTLCAFEFIHNQTKKKKMFNKNVYI